MSQYFDEKGDLCLNTKRWPVDVNEMNLRLQKTIPTGTAGQMSALHAVGLVKGEDTEVDIMGMMGKPTGAKAKIKRYALTDAAKPFAQEKDVDSIGLNGKTTANRPTSAGARKPLTRL